MDTLGQAVSASSKAGDAKLVRASTTVGPNGDNNTLLGVGNRLVNVGSTGCTSDTMRNVKCTVPVSGTGPVLRRLVGHRAERGMSDDGGKCLKMDLTDLAARTVRVCGVPANTFMEDIRSSSPTRRTNVYGNSVVMGFSKRGIDSNSSLLSGLRCCGSKRGVRTIVTETAGKRCRRGAVRLALNAEPSGRWGGERHPYNNIFCVLSIGDGLLFAPFAMA